MARELGIPGLAGLLAAVPLCFMMCRCEALRSSGCGHMADGIGAEQAVYRTACPGFRWPAIVGEEPPGSRQSTVKPARAPWRRLGAGSPGQELPPVDVGGARPTSLSILRADRDAPTSGLT
jgi:hypothetical protein